MLGKLLVIEGLDGSGKTTQLVLLQNRLQQDGCTTRQIKLPNYDDPACAPVKMYLDGRFGGSPEAVNAYAASTFYAVDRYVSYQCYWKSDYLDGTLILSDRYATSNLYHQAIKLPKTEWPDFFRWCEDFEYGKMGIPKPNLVLYLDMPIAVSQALLTQRYGGDTSKKDIHERDIAYLHRCREAALFAAAHLGWQVIPCAANDKAYDIETLSTHIYQTVSSFLQQP